MQDNSYLPNLINEDIYVIKENSSAPEVRAVAKEVIDIETVPENSVEEPATVYVQPLPTEGNNLKHCLVFVESTETILDKDSKTFLENILKSVKRSLEDILIVNVKEANEEQIQAILAEQNHRQLLVFGSEKMTSLKDIDNYSVYSENHKSFLKADGLDTISKAVEKKKALWAALQEIFL